MASTSKKKLSLNTVSLNLGCNSCKKPNLSNIFHPKPKPKPNNTTTIYHNHHHHLYYSSSTSSTATTATTPTTTSLSPATDTPPYHYHDTNNINRKKKKKKMMNTNKNINKCSRTTVRGLGRVGGESEAVEKDSDDPYLDFRHSMLQMILEKEIYSKDDLKELLNCFLQLNSPYHHGIIVRAFTEIWNGVYSVKSSSSSFNTGTATTTSNVASSCSQLQQHHHYQKLHYFHG